MKLSIIIPAFNAELTIKACLDSLLPQLSEGDEIIVVNDASTDGTGYVLAEYNSKVRTVFLSKNGGVAKAIKEGFDYAMNDVVCVIDSDSIAMDGWLSTIRRAFTHNVVLAGGSYQSSNDAYRNIWLSVAKKHAKSKNISGSNMAIHKIKAIELGLMNDLPQYSWDKMVQERAKKSKYQVLFFDKPVLTITPTSWRSIAKQSFRYGRGRPSRGRVSLKFLLKRGFQLIIFPLTIPYFIYLGKQYDALDVVKACCIEYYRSIIHTGGLFYGIINK